MPLLTIIRTIFLYFCSSKAAFSSEQRGTFCLALLNVSNKIQRVSFYRMMLNNCVDKNIADFIDLDI